MPEVIPFDEAINRTNGKDRSLLIGNGFSIDHFSYRTLLENAGLGQDDPVRRLFKVLDTFDFESVMSALEDAADVERAYGNQAHEDQLRSDADRLRESLVHAIRSTHPAHRDDIVDRVPSCVQFLKNFSKLFSLN